jgi:transcriptional regulator with XRE-family HTH domain
MPPLQTVRRAQGLSQRALADRTGLRLETVYHIEHGNRLPRLGVMRLICAVLRVPPHEVDEFQKAIDAD